MDVGARATSAVAVRVGVVREAAVAGTTAMTAAAYRMEKSREVAARVVGSAARREVAGSAAAGIAVWP